MGSIGRGQCDLLFQLAVLHTVHSHGLVATAQHVGRVYLELGAVRGPGERRACGLAFVVGEHAQVAGTVEQELALDRVRRHERPTQLLDVVGEQRLDGRVRYVDDRVRVVACQTQERFVDFLANMRSATYSI